MTTLEALAFIEEHGVVLEAARGPVPSLIEAIAGGPVRGNWWSHAKSQQMFAVTRAMREHADILVCRVVDGKVTFVHRRLWPALVRVAHRIPASRLCQVVEVHTETGRHETREVPFPEWAPPAVLAAARRLSEEAAIAEFASWIGSATG